MASTVKAYLAALPADRRATLEAVRKVILKNLDKDYEEGMQYGMIGYYIPHRVYPAGYHCDAKQPLPFASLASRKSHCSVSIMALYGFGGKGNPLAEWFAKEWAKTGKKLDMGAACIRFKKVEDLALDLIGKVFARVPAKKYIAVYESVLARGKRKG
jgi:hypothetical protein